MPAPVNKLNDPWPFIVVWRDLDGKIRQTGCSNRELAQIVHDCFEPGDAELIDVEAELH